MKIYERICPNPNNNTECKKYLTYSSYSTWWVANKNNSVCNSCSKKGCVPWIKGKHHTEESKEKISSTQIGKSLTKEHKEKLSTAWINRKKNHPFTEETLEKMRNRVPWNKGKKGTIVPWNKGISHSKRTIQKIKEKCKNKIVTEETKYKLRIAAINNLIKKGIVGGIRGKNFNPKACEFIDKLNKERGWNLQHALNGGEVELYGYFVDGYDKERNIIFEYDEKHHYISDRILKPKDDIRQKRLINSIKPFKFIRYDEKTNQLYDVNLNLSSI